MITKKTITIPNFIRIHADKAVLDSVQLALYVTICKMLGPELAKMRKRNN